MYNRGRTMEVTGVHPIASYRRARGMTQSDLAKKIGVVLPTVQRWEDGAIPRARILPRLADALGIEAMALDREISGWRAELGRLEGGRRE